MISSTEIGKAVEDLKELRRVSREINILWGTITVEISSERTENIILLSKHYSQEVYNNIRKVLEADVESARVNLVELCKKYVEQETPDDQISSHR